jgi:hypothetical protein
MTEDRCGLFNYQPVQSVFCHLSSVFWWLTPETFQKVVGLATVPTCIGGHGGPPYKNMH